MTDTTKALAAITEYERVNTELIRLAEAATKAAPPREPQYDYWFATQPGKGTDWMVDSPTSFVCSTHLDDDKAQSFAEHIAANDPASVIAAARFALRVAAADRALLKRHADDEGVCAWCNDWANRLGPAPRSWPCPDVADRLALWASDE